MAVLGTSVSVGVMAEGTLTCHLQLELNAKTSTPMGDIMDLTTVKYLVAQRRAHLDYARRSLAIARERNSRRHERQAIAHERRAANLAGKILQVLDSSL